MTLPGLFVTGTDTGVGKTRVSSSIVRSLRESGLRVAVQKPVATGATRVGPTWQCDDSRILIEAAQSPDTDPIPLSRVSPFLFEEPLAPSLAARRSGTPLTLDAILASTLDNLAWWSARADLAVIEGVGGLLCPLGDDSTVLDLAVSLDFPLLIVARFTLGTLNHTLMTVHIARAHGLRVSGILLNHAEPSPLDLAGKTVALELSRLLDDVPILGEIGFEHDYTLLSRPLHGVDWNQRARPPRHQP